MAGGMSSLQVWACSQRLRGPLTIISAAYSAGDLAVLTRPIVTYINTITCCLELRATVRHMHAQRCACPCILATLTLFVNWAYSLADDSGLDTNLLLIGSS